VSKRPNILLISIDSLRADHLGCYGYPKPTSPFIDSLAGEGVLAESLFCPGLPTYPSYTTLYTAQHPLTHGILAHGSDAKLDRNAPFLPHVLVEAGYTTCAIDNLMHGRIWFGRGYEFYIDPSVKLSMLTMNVTCDQLNARAIPWLRQHGDEPFFLFIHYWDPHWPFMPPASYNNLFYEGDNPTDKSNRALEPFWKHPLGAVAKETWLRTPKGPITDPAYVSALYDREIRYLDDGISRLLQALDAAGLAENTLVLFTADHGESLTEHGIFFDHHGLYDCTTHVPLIARWPGRLPSGVRIPDMVQVMDIAPTILEAAGIAAPASMEGRSFWKLLTGEEAGDPSRTRVISAENTWQSSWSLRTATHKLILARDTDVTGRPEVELYDLIADPQEERNIANEEPQRVAAMRDELEGWIAERLQALGKDRDPLLAQGASMRMTLAQSAH
jgi:arylsulfatase A-like enzyme